MGDSLGARCLPIPRPCNGYSTIILGPRRPRYGKRKAVDNEEESETEDLPGESSSLQSQSVPSLSAAPSINEERLAALKEFPFPPGARIQTGHYFSRDRVSKVVGGSPQVWSVISSSMLHLTNSAKGHVSAVSTSTDSGTWSW